MYNRTMDEKKTYQIGMTVYGQVTGLKPYGAFVQFEDGYSGLIHISELSNGFVKNIGHFMNIGDFVLCKVIDIDYDHRQLRLSYKALKRNRRDRFDRVPFLGIPENKIGFRTLAEKMPEWLKN